MSFKPSETGRVKSIKSKFENLNSLESLDISASIPHKYRKPSPSHQFKRSATSIDFSCRKLSVANGNNNGVSNVSAAIENNGHKAHLRRHNNLEKTISDDTISLKKRNTLNAANGEDTLKPLKEIKENVEVRLNRHINDPVKRSSIKRSPAFRVGDTSTNNGTSAKSIKANSAKSSPTSVPKEFAEKFDELLKRCVTDSQKLQEAGLTDTLKAVLRQPLPTGPPPKKPPRTFTDAPATRINHTNDVNGNEKKSNASPTASSPNGELKQKIDLLENQLVLKPTTKSKGTHRKASKEKHVFSSSLFNCIPCSSAPVYDTMIINRNQPSKATAVASKQQTCDATTPNKFTSRTTPSPTNQTHASRSKTEHIYMEPFAHLKSNSHNNNSSTSSSNGISNTNSCTNSHSQHCNNNNTSSINNNSNHNTSCSGNFSLFENSNSNIDATDRAQSVNESKLSSSFSNGSLDGESIGSSLVSCTSCAADDHSITDSHDIHYMCTSIENKIKSSDSDSTSNENDHPLTLSNTYDEINILVNAAFAGQHKMGNTFDTSETSSTTATDASAPSSADNQQKTTIKLSRTLTEKRKDYVRRVSAVKPIPDHIASPDSTFKPTVFRTFSIDNTAIETRENNEDWQHSITPKKRVSERILEFNRNAMTKTPDERTPLQSKVAKQPSIDETDGTCQSAVDSDIAEIEDSPKLFQVCLLIGYNISTRQAYIKSKFPPDEDIPPNIEQLVFPSSNLINQTQVNQDYSIILTDHSGYHVYGYCRRVLPESCEICLPLAYCIISEIKAPGFYFKILKEIETRHGQAEFQRNFLLQNLQNRSIPEPGKFLHLKLPLSPKPKTISTSHHKITPKRLSLEVNPKWLTESAAQAAFSSADSSPIESTTTTKKDRSNPKSLIQEFEEKKQLEKEKANGAPFDLSLINRSLLSGSRGNGKCDEIFIRRPNDLRLESTELSDLYKTLGPDLLITVFSTLLLERKVILYTENISVLSSCVLGLQTLLYPFQWQHALITILPQNLTEVCQAPIPVLAGMLEPIAFDIEDGIVINLNNRTIVQKCGDETTILPSSLSDSLKVSLEMVDLLDQGKMLSSVLIAEAFLRCFVELFVNYKHKHFDKKLFIESHSSQSYRLFLEWFVETAMFRHFVYQKFKNECEAGETEVDTTTESKFYDLFDSRILKSEHESSSTQQNMEMIMKNCRVINKKAKTFKDRFKDFIGSNHSHHNHGNDK